eukprot:PITA_29733
MMLISWNITGLNGPGKCKLIKNMIKQEKPQIIFLQETKCKSISLDRIATKVWPGSLATTVDSYGASGGLAIIWDARTIELNNIHANKHFLQATFHITGTNIHGHITNLYFPQEAMHKVELLNTLSSINTDRSHPLWIIGGDFNMITKMEEKRGGRKKTNKESNNLKYYIQRNWLIDMPFNNGLFTWNNKRAGSHQIASRLDRFLIFDNAIHLGGDLSASIPLLTVLDHWSISLQWSRLGNATHRPFRFEAFWMTHPDFVNLVNSEWTNFLPPNGTRMFKFQQKLKNLKSKIKQWNHSLFGGKSRKNEEIELKLLNYFKQTHQEPQVDRMQAIGKITKNIPKVITEEHNQLLLRPIDLQEVENVVHQMKEGKASGLDGFTPNFFHNFWELIKMGVWQVVEELRTLGWMLPAMNATFIALTPKGAQCSTPDKFRPISLCNIIYKIISKIVASRLKPLLPLLISLERSG